MIDRARIVDYANSIAREFCPEKIVLFGSHAYGKPSGDSDVDLLVVMPHRGRARDKAIQIRNRLDAPFPMDLLVRSPETVAQRIGWGDGFLREVMQRGEVLYESAHA